MMSHSISAELSVSMYAELKPQLNSVQVVLIFPRALIVDRQSGVQVTTKKDEIKVTLLNKTCSFQLKGLTFEPTSCSGLQWRAGKEMSFRLKCSEIDEDALNMQNNTKQNYALLLKHFNVPNFTCTCLTCGYPVLSNIRFKRILPLPSEGWADNMDSWFCHKHADDKSSNQLSLNPSPQDCFVADLYFVIHKSLIKHTCLTNNGQIQCRRCRQVVGQLYTLDKISTQDAAQIYKSFVHFGGSTSISLDNESHRVSQASKPSVRLEEDLYDFLLHQTTAYRGYRLIVECRSDSSSKPTASILLWVLDSNSQIFASHSEIRDVTITADPQKALRVLYRHCLTTKNESVLKQWRVDLAVHTLEIPQTLTHHFLQILQSSTISLPTSLRTANGFFVGHLKKKQMKT